MKLDQKYHAAVLPGKFKMAVSGCKLSCSESWVRDIGLIGFADGWTLTIGGNVGMTPRIGKELKTGLNDEQVLTAVEKVISVYMDQAKPGERLGKMIERVGLDPFQTALE
jgi:NAD(P)H-nitrite reductase large subunit